MIVNEDSDGWVVIGSTPGRRQLAFQRASSGSHRAGRSPLTSADARRYQPDSDAAELDLLSLGAKRTPAERETGFRVFTDPVGHPFCKVFRWRPRLKPGRSLLNSVPRETPAASAMGRASSRLDGGRCAQGRCGLASATLLGEREKYVSGATYIH
jgi:hypothetical protein